MRPAGGHTKLNVNRCSLSLRDPEQETGQKFPGYCLYRVVMRFLGPLPAHDLTYSDVFLVPSRSAVTSRLDVDLAPGDGTGATIPIVSANMNSVTGPLLAATLARRGGLGVLPQDLPLQELAAAIRWVKAQPVAWDTPVVLAPEQTVAEALKQLPPTEGHGVVLRSASGRSSARSLPPDSAPPSPMHNSAISFAVR